VPERTEFVEANGIRFHVKVEGDGPLVVLIHGFPQTSYAWHHVMPLLAERGFRVAAPDTRGIGQSSRPTRIADYRLQVLGDDIAALIGALGADKASVIGHDWGGLIAWETAFAHPEVVDRLITVNGPPAHIPPQGWGARLRQLSRSWYAFYFALPRNPERFLTRGHSQIMARLLRDGRFSPEEIALYRDVICQPGAAWAGLAYYRAWVRGLRANAARLRGRTVTAPTLVIWGEQDPALGLELIEDMDRYVRGPLRIVRLPEENHWFVPNQPERFVDLVTAFLEEAFLEPAAALEDDEQDDAHPDHEDQR
jgi:pimeloyl-ACP methyl ester carboxylesterase